MARSSLSQFRYAMTAGASSTIVYDTISSVTAGSLIVVGWRYEGGGGSGGTMCRVYDIGANSLRDITLTGSDISGDAYGGSLVYVRAMDCYIVCIPAIAGAAIYKITPNTGTSWACSLITTTSGSGIPLTNDSSAHWPWTKFLYLPEFGVAVFGPRWGSNVFALKLHEI
jgi:hypothetical protein